MSALLHLRQAHRFDQRGPWILGLRRLLDQVAACVPGPRTVRCVAAIGIALLGSGSAATAEPADPLASHEEADAWWRRVGEHERLGDAHGFHEALAEYGVEIEVAYAGDVASTLDGGVETGTEVLGNLDAMFLWRTEPLMGRDLGNLFLYGLFNHGGNPSANAGDLQGVDNNAAPRALQLYEAWWQKRLFESRASLLVGLYDVNSEFDVIDSAELFIHSSFGMGADLGTSGVNGPSIFPVTSAGARVSVLLTAETTLQIAVLDGIPGDPDGGAGSQVHWRSGDGVFAIGELAHVWGSVRRDERGDPLDRTTDHRHVGRGYGAPDRLLRVALGTWAYSTSRDHLFERDANGRPDRESGHPGFYALAELDTRLLGPRHARGATAFLRAGLADGDVQEFAGYTGAGVTYIGPIPARPGDQLGVGVAAAYTGHAFRRATRALGDKPSRAEVAFEVTYRAPLVPWLSIQADLQYVLDPGGLRSRSDALVGILRYVIEI